MAEALKHNLKLIGRYAILRELRRDRYTAAYLALDPVLNREVVVKAVQLRPAAGQEATGHDRIDQAFTRQAQAAGRLVHPHILSVFDAGRVQNVGYLALEKVNGKLLGAALADGWRPSALEVADIAARVADAVEFAHARGVPHGHLSASRVYLQEPERVPKVMGFGGWIDTGVTGDFELAATEAMLPYFANELGPEARRKDVRALGALLFLLLTGTRPDPKVVGARRTGGIILELQPSAPPTLAGIAEGALELREAPWYGSAGQVRDALTAFLWSQRDAQALPNAATMSRSAARPATVPRPSPATLPAALPVRAARDAPSSRRGLFRAGALAALLVALAAIAVVGVRAADDAPAGARPARTSTPPMPPVAAGPAAPGGEPTGSAAAPTARTSAQTTHFGPAPTAVRGAVATDSGAGAGPASAPPPATRPFQ